MEDEIRKWLDKTGYPLEARVGKILRASGFGVIHSEYYPDPETDEHREIDVSAFTSVSTSEGQFWVELTVECKNIRESPWVVFVDKSTLPPELFVAQRNYTAHSRQLVQRVAKGELLHGSSLFWAPDATGYSVTPFRSEKRRDDAYSALRSVASAAQGCIARISKATNASDHIHALALPMLVVEGRIFECEFTESGVDLRETHDTVLAWRRPVGARHCFVRIMTEQGLGDAAADLQAGAVAFIAAMQEQARMPPN